MTSTPPFRGVDGSETYDVIYNTCYGGFSYPYEFVEKVFKMWPPHTPQGQWLFRACSKFESETKIEPGTEPNLEWSSYNEIVGREEYIEGFERLHTVYYVRQKDNAETPWKKVGIKAKLYIQHTESKKLYFLSEHVYGDAWRALPELVELVKSEGLIQTCFNHAKLAIAEVPNDYTFDIQEYDGKESVIPLFPYHEVIRELVQYAKDHDESKLSPLALKAVRGELPANY